MLQLNKYLLEYRTSLQPPPDCAFKAFVENSSYCTGR